MSSVYPVPVMLLTTTGAKTGQPRTLPLLYVTDGDRILLIASNYGQAPPPGVVPGIPPPTRRSRCSRASAAGPTQRAEITDPAERERAWDLARDQYAGYADYEVRSGDRTIPLVRLERASG